MGISLKTHKLLWGRSGNQCAICRNELILFPGDPSDDPSVVGDEAHIVAKTETFTRGDYERLSPGERDAYSNLILLCKVHHKQIDDQPSQFTVERLREIKESHEKSVRSRLTRSEENEQQDAITYSGYVDHWEGLADLDNWRNLSWHAASSDTPALRRPWYDAQRELMIWTIGRIWPGRYPRLEGALLNYKAVVQDFLNVFDRHVETDQNDRDYLYTPKFYKITEWNPALYGKLARKFDAHVDLVCDLFFELTRAANYVCDQVREYIFPGYRLREGALLVERHFVGHEMQTVYSRAEYRVEERTERPYPGLEDFMRIRYTRDHFIDPDPPGPPAGDKEGEP